MFNATAKQRQDDITCLIIIKMDEHGDVKDRQRAETEEYWLVFFYSTGLY